ncbi:MAG: DUF4011 domain-containing protein [Isosphaeraceae bacterium]|nr:DUF4011 domain-containing protein [Isosphaeraceae bacterium]
MPPSLENRLEEWRRELLDTTKRNPLISLKLGKSGAVEILDPTGSVLWEELIVRQIAVRFSPRGASESSEAGDEETPTDETPPPVRLPGTAWTDQPDDKLSSRLANLAKIARTAAAELGISTLHVAFGMVHWAESPESSILFNAPLLLYPIELKRGNIQADWEMKPIEAEPIVNQTLAQLLLDQFRLAIPGMPDLPGDESVSSLHSYLASVREAIRDAKNWSVSERCVIGNFAFQKIAMWQDLGKNSRKILQHPICRAIAGDSEAMSTGISDLPTARQLDSVADPLTTFHVLDCDSSQHEAIEAAKRGVSLVLDGPPGTGKSQTIANIISEFLAANRTVLFVSEKAAALEVVKKRLEEKGLIDFCLDCHGREADKKAILKELGKCLELDAPARSEPTQPLERLRDHRAKLNAVVAALHQKREPLGKSVFEVQGLLASLHSAPATRLHMPDPLEISGSRLREIDSAFDELADLGPTVREFATHPWRRLDIDRGPHVLRERIEHHLERLRSGLRRAVEGIEKCAPLGLISESTTLDPWIALVESIGEPGSIPLVPRSWFQSDPGASASRCLELESEVSGLRRLVEKNPLIIESAVLALDEVGLSRIRRQNGRCALTLIEAERPTVRRERDRLQDTLDALSKLRIAAHSAMLAHRVVVERLDLPKTRFRFAIFSKVARLLARSLTVSNREHFGLDPSSRAEVLKIVRKCLDVEAEASDIRARLVEQLLPSAFDPEAAPRARAVLGFQSRILRLLPAWSNARREIAELYPHDLPETSDLFSQIKLLVEYHDLIQSTEKLGAAYAGRLLVDHRGRVDWKATEQSLLEVAKFDDLLKLYKTLPDSVGRLGEAETHALRAECTQLARSAEQVEEAMSTTSEILDLSNFLKNTAEQRLTIEDLLARIDSTIVEVRARIETLDAVTSLIPAHRDFALRSLPECVQLVDRIRGHDERIRHLSTSIGIAPGDPMALDLAGLADSSRKLIAWLNKRTDRSIPAVFVNVFTDAQLHVQASEILAAAYPSLPELRESWTKIQWTLRVRDADDREPELSELRVYDLVRWVEDRLLDLDRIDEWYRFKKLQRRFDAISLQEPFREVLGGRLDPERARSAFQCAFYRAWLDQVSSEEPHLDSLTTEGRRREIEEFRRLDLESIRIAPTRVREILLSAPGRPRPDSLQVPKSSELGTLLREINKKSRHLPLRDLIAKCPTHLQRIKPCLMMSPLAVSTHLSLSDIHFDLVIFDEASQVRPYDAISSIFRGTQLIVAGDQKQLPPTNFFERMAEEDESDSDDEDRISDYESILDVCCTLGFARKRLRWHYRSRRESLIAFSNRYFYDGELVTFPSAVDEMVDPGVRFIHVAEGRWRSGSSGGFNAVEAATTARMVIEHFRRTPEKSLGVITMNSRQERAILDELERLRREDLSLEEFFDHERPEPFFVKNLENVQGDEREVIFLSIAYGPDDQGRVYQRFGPLNVAGGERRLNVAITRARESMTVISSMRPHDIDLTKSKARGVHLLRAYLDFAERGAAALDSQSTASGLREFDSPFEAEVARALEARGLRVLSQVGCGGYRIDLALTHPNHPGLFVLGIECDGATYHSSATARDRDRLRQDVLERLGWHILRVWSTDWVRGRAQQIDRIVTAYEARIVEHDAAAATASEIDPTQDVGSDLIELDLNEEPTGTSDPEDRQDIEHETAQPGSPRIRIAPQPPRKIHEFSDNEIRDTILSTLRSCGPTENDDLTKAVSLTLGFQRTGIRIKERLESTIDRLRRDGLIERCDGTKLRVVAFRSQIS